MLHKDEVPLKISDESLIERLMTLTPVKRLEILVSAAREAGAIQRLYPNRSRITSYGHLVMPVRVYPRSRFEKSMNHEEYRQLKLGLSHTYTLCLRKQFLTVLSSS